VFSVCGKVGAVFVTIPDPVLGGTTVVGFGIFIGLILANLQYVDLNSSRNLAVLGVSILVGLMIPNWTKHNSELINTGEWYLFVLLIVELINNRGVVFVCFVDISGIY
jgi:nucleobase transporter 1/2